MIKADKGVFYLTCGEGCYIARVDGGRLKHVWFGRRVEQEDDLVALGAGGDDEFFVESVARSVAVDDRTGEEVKVDFEFVSAEIEEKTAVPGLPTLRGGEALKVTLADGKAGLTAELYYSAYTRGGIARRAVVKNTGKRTLRLRVPGMNITLAGEYSEFGCGEGNINFIGLKNSEEAYGFCMLFGGGAVTAVTHGDGFVSAECTAAEDVALRPGESVFVPETLCVYSDMGSGGMSRIFHDIIRDCAIPARFKNRRMPIALFCGEEPQKQAAVLAQLGVDALVCAAEPDSDLRELSAECKDNGIVFGASISLKPQDLPLDSAKGVNDAFDKLSRFVAECGIEYLIIDVGAPRGYGGRRGLYFLLEKLTEKFPELTVTSYGDVGCLCYSPFLACVGAQKAFMGDGALCTVVPPCALGCRITGAAGVSIKTEFDVSSLGCLGYELDAAALNANIRRAIRAQVFCYQDDSELVRTGDLYPPSATDGNLAAEIVSKDKSCAYAVYYCAKAGSGRMRFTGLDEHNLYYIRELDRVFSGAALCGVGVPVPTDVREGDTLTFHLRQVADYE